MLSHSGMSGSSQPRGPTAFRRLLCLQGPPGMFCPCSARACPLLLCCVPQSCPTLCDLMDCSPPGSFVHSTFQARILEWVPSPGDLPKPGIEPVSRGFFTIESPGKPHSPPYHSLKKIPSNTRHSHSIALLLHLGRARDFHT